MLPGLRRRDTLLGVEPRRRRNRNNVSLGILEHFLVGGEVRDVPLRCRLSGALRIAIAHCHQLQPLDLVNRLEVVLADAATAD